MIIIGNAIGLPMASSVIPRAELNASVSSDAARTSANRLRPKSCTYRCGRPALRREGDATTHRGPRVAPSCTGPSMAPSPRPQPRRPLCMSLPWLHSTTCRVTDQPHHGYYIYYVAHDPVASCGASLPFLPKSTRQPANSDDGQGGLHVGF
jgi:hypothetical protein